MQNNSVEYWLRGPVEGVPSLLQPVAHALLQANKEIQDIVKDFPKEKLWQKPAGVASVGFHLQHIVGVLDRLFTYSKGNSLTETQLDYLHKEGKEGDTLTSGDLAAALQQQIHTSVAYLKTIDENTLTQARPVGRKQLPSTIMGLLFHAAEHTMRHTGQLLVTARVLMQ
ncbi:DinB family protein [Ilyomonas limi]|uniref:DinB family protein n=1 Tax=Ilyomonas limi TaxID=2575867 RepID=A0A4U3L0K7_9BACT|nr:DinB family protein [Ilyomonas limi]TKK67729.1 DinB family protein [Ilyomonas limi]